MSLRALMIAVLVLGGGLGWLVRRAHLQRRAVAALTAGAVGLSYDWRMGDPKTGRKALKEPPGPPWLRRWVGDEFFQEVVFVELMQPATASDMAIVAEFDHLESLRVRDVAGLGDGFGRLAGIATLRSLQIGRTQGDHRPGLTDAILAPVGRLTGLETLKIDRGEISDAGLDSVSTLNQLKVLSLTGCSGLTTAGLTRFLAHTPLLEDLDLTGMAVDDAIMPAVGRLPHLRALNLTATGITNAGMAHLAHLTKLETLQIRQTAVGDAGLAHLKDSTALQRLLAGSTPITDAGLAHLSGLTGLSVLELTGTAITDAGLVHLAPLQKLTSLRAVTTAISDAGTPALARLRGLQILSLTKTKVTDAGLPPLADLKQLTSLQIQETAVTAEGETEFRRLLPTLRNFQRGTYVRPATARAVPVRPGARDAESRP